MTSQELLSAHAVLKRCWDDLQELKASLLRGPTVIAISNAQGELSSAMGNLHREIGKAVINESAND